jgi:SAM-dependent methyltransferase
MPRLLPFSLNRLAPSHLRRRGRHWLHRLALLWDSLSGKKTVRQPPIELIDRIGGSWWVGDHYLKIFRDLCDLKADEAVLDVGCGIGRMAIPLLSYLDANGRYEGFDIMRENVKWCRHAISPRWPNFRFQHADIFNRDYNPNGLVRCGEFRFPYADATFDFAFLTSVFTHLMPSDIAHYLHELGRVLKPDGRCLATFFLLNPESNALIDSGRSHFTFHPQTCNYRVHSHEVPEACLAVEQEFVEEAARRAGLAMETPRYGSWAGRNLAFDFQDVVVFRKR